MALHSRWSSGDLIFYDGTQEILRIKNGTGGIVVGTTGAEVPITLYGNITYTDPRTISSTGNITLTTTSSRTQFVDSCGQAVTWALPAEADAAGIEFKIVNFSTGGAITVNDDSSGCIAVVDADEVGYLLCDGVTWGAMVNGPST